jgi:hypothetical protein
MTDAVPWPSVSAAFAGGVAQVETDMVALLGDTDDPVRRSMLRCFIEYWHSEFVEFDIDALMGTSNSAGTRFPGVGAARSVRYVRTRIRCECVVYVTTANKGRAPWLFLGSEPAGGPTDDRNPRKEGSWPRTQDTCRTRLSSPCSLQHSSW